MTARKPGIFDGRDGRSVAGVPPTPTVRLPAVRVERHGIGAATATLDFGPGDAFFTLRRLPATASAPAVWRVTLDGGYHFPHVNAGDYVPSIKHGIILAVERRARILAVREVMGR